MEITYHGANCLTLTTKKATVVIDDNLADIGAKTINKATIRIYSNRNLKPETPADEAFVIDGPGEYEISKVSVIGVPAQSHMDEPGKHTATIYKVISEGVSLAIVGHVMSDLSDEQLEQIGVVDILIVPVGGNGYTLDKIGAAKMIKKIEPKAVIPTHYAQKGINYEVPQAELAEFMTEIGAEPTKEDKLKLKGGVIAGENLVVYELAIA